MSPEGCWNGCCEVIAAEEAEGLDLIVGEGLGFAEDIGGREVKAADDFTAFITHDAVGVEAVTELAEEHGEDKLIDILLDGLGEPGT